MADSIRQKRVNQAIFKIMSQVMLLHYSGTELSSVLISRVKVSPDLRNATVFYTLFQNAPRKMIADRLEQELKQIRMIVAKELNHLKYVPKIVFKYDDKHEEIQRVEEILGQIKKEKDED